jgi:hypothetical protein
MMARSHVGVTGGRLKYTVSMQTWIRLTSCVWMALLVVGLSTLAACEEEGCEPYAASSVGFIVVDSTTDEPILDAVVEYQVDGGAVRMPDYNDGEGQFALAYETPGVFTVTIEAAGYETVNVEYMVVQGECHVESIGDTIEMIPTP